MKIKEININNRYIIYTNNWSIYDTEKALDIPQEIFDLMEKIKSNKKATNTTDQTLGDLLMSKDEIIKRNATSILKRLQRLADYWHFSTPIEYQEHLRKSGEIYDNLIIGNILFTMDNYDRDGQMITYGNLKHKKEMTIQTANRYGQGLQDAIVEIRELTCWRNDISYIE